MHHVRVKQCQVTKCCYNKDKKCHALAIQVGDAQKPACDTFTSGQEQCGVQEMTAEVGACKMTDCRYNRDHQCDAEAIDVTWKQDTAECNTFQPR